MDVLEQRKLRCTPHWGQFRPDPMGFGVVYRSIDRKRICNSRGLTDGMRLPADHPMAPIATDLRQPLA